MFGLCGKITLSGGSRLLRLDGGWFLLRCGLRCGLGLAIFLPGAIRADRLRKVCTGRQQQN